VGGSEGGRRGGWEGLTVPEGLIGGESERRYERNGRGGGVTDILVRLVRGGAAAVRKERREERKVRTVSIRKGGRMGGKEGGRKGGREGGRAYLE